MPLHQEPGQKPSQPGKGWPGLPGKCGLVKPTKHGHSQAFLATLAAKAWPSWPCYFRGRAFSATLVIKARPNPGLNYSSQAWPGFFEFQGQKFITLRDCNMNISFSVFGPGQPLPGQAGLGLWPWHSGFFFIPWPTWPKPGHKPGSPQLSGQALTPVWPGS